MKKEFFTMVLGRMLLAISSLLLVRVYTSILSATEVGKLNILQTIFTLITLAFLTPVGMYFNRMAVEWDLKGLCQRYFKYFTCIIVLISIISIIPVYIYENIFGLGIKIDLITLLLMAATAPALGAIQTTILSVLNLLGNRKSYVVLTNFSNWGMLIIATIMVLLFNKTAEYWIFGQQIAFLTTIILAYKKLCLGTNISVIQIKFNKLYIEDSSIRLREIIKYVFPYSLIMIFYWIQIYCYQLILNHYDGTENVGLFATGFKIGSTPISIFDAILFQYFISEYFRNIANASNEIKTVEWNKFANKLLPLILPLVIAVFISSKPLTNILVSESFSASSEYVIWGAITEGLRVFSTVISQVAISRMNTRALIIPSLIPALSAIAIQLLLIESNPLQATGISLAAGMSINVLVSWYVAKRLMPKIMFPWKLISISLIYATPLLLIYNKQDIILTSLALVFDGTGWEIYLSSIIYLIVVFSFFLIPIYMTYKIESKK